MTVEKLDDKKLLIALCEKDMERLEITPKTISLSDPEFKNTVKAILSLAVYESGINTKDKKAVIEILPYENGCFLLVSFMSKNGYGKKYKIINRTETIFMFHEFENLISLSFAIGDDKTVKESSVFEYKGKYFLSVKNLHPLREKRINEFASRVRVNAIQMSRYREYGNILLNNNALAIVKNIFKN